MAAVRGQEGLQLRTEGGIIRLRHHAQGRSREAAAVYPDGSPAPQQAAAQGQGHGQLLVPGGPLRGDVLQIFPGGAAGVVD